MRKTLFAAALLALSASAVAAPVTYKLDPAHTNVLASWSHFGYSNPSLDFTGVDGTLVYDAAAVTKSKVEVTLPLSGLQSFTEKFNTHLSSPDFFDAAKFPTAKFVSTKVEAAGKDKLKVTGNLTVKDVTKPVVLDVTLNKVGPHPMSKAESIGFDATTTLSRTEFGVGAYAPAVSDAVKIRITTEGSVPAAK